MKTDGIKVNPLSLLIITIVKRSEFVDVRVRKKISLVKKIRVDLSRSLISSQRTGIAGVADTKERSSTTQVARRINGRSLLEDLYSKTTFRY